MVAAVYPRPMKLLGGSVVIIAALVLAGCGADDPETFTAAGTVTVPGGSSTAEEACPAAVEVDEGTTLTVLDAAGDKVAVGELGEGEPQGGDGLFIGCRHSFEIAGVPDGDAVYSLQVGSGESYNFKRSEASKVGVVVGLD